MILKQGTDTPMPPVEVATVGGHETPHERFDTTPLLEVKKHVIVVWHEAI